MGDIIIAIVRLAILLTFLITALASLYCVIKLTRFIRTYEVRNAELALRDDGQEQRLQTLERAAARTNGGPP